MDISYKRIEDARSLRNMHGETPTLDATLSALKEEVEIICKRMDARLKNGSLRSRLFAERRKAELYHAIAIVRAVRDGRPEK